MRTIFIDISKFMFNIDDTVSLRLVDIVGNNSIADNYTYDENFIIDANNLLLELRENDSITSDTTYKMTALNKEYFFKVINYLGNTDPLDLYVLQQLGCHEEIIKIEDEITYVNKSFLKKLDLYFTGENPYFTEYEENFLELYVLYADQTHGTANTVDVLKIFDEYISTLK